MYDWLVIAISTIVEMLKMEMVMLIGTVTEMLTVMMMAMIVMVIMNVLMQRHQYNESVLRGMM